MNTWRPKKNGVNETTQFMRYQNDFFHNVKMTMIHGRVLYENGKFLTDESPEDIYRKANDIISEMK